MGVYKYLRELWKKPSHNLGDIQKQRLAEWRKQASTIRIAKPTRLDRAHALGYKAKQGFLVVRQHVGKSSRKRPQIKRGRRSKAQRRKKIVALNYQQIAEMRANKKFLNCNVLNSYWVGEDGKGKWYEVILVDRDHPNIQKDEQLRNLAEKRGRAFRGLTSSGRKSRGLRYKGKGVEKARPSLRANKRRLN